MGEYADMMLNGEMCEWCGTFLGGGSGYARICRGCRMKEQQNKKGKSVDSEDFDVYRQRKIEKRKQQINSFEDEEQFLKGLKKASVMKVESDGSDGKKYTILVLSDRGHRTVEWWTKTGLWKVVRGRAEGYGLYRMARYFQIVPPKGGEPQHP